MLRTIKKYLAKWANTPKSKQLRAERTDALLTNQDTKTKVDSDARSVSTPSFTSDAPIQSAREDRFERARFAIQVARTLAIRSDSSSLVVGVYAPWGDGKTSTIRMMEEALSQYKDVVIAKFNPWYFDTEEKLLQAFFSLLAETLGKSLATKGQEIGAALNKYGFLLAPINADGVVKGAGEMLASVDLPGQRSRIERLLGESNVRVVVTIDDVDRLQKQEIQALMRLVKLTADFRHISYVLAFDHEIVASALAERYGDGGAEAGRRFLEKIVQVPLHLPPADSIELRKFSFEGIEQALTTSEITLTEDQGNRFGRHYVDGIEPAITTPRKAKQYANALLFALPILKSETDPVDLMLIEGVRICYPALYKIIRNHPEIFVPGARERGGRDQEHIQRVSGLISQGLHGIDLRQVEFIRKRLIEELFPRISNMGYGPEWDRIWEKSQRICSSEYFQRYFTYSIPRRDVADLAINEFVATAQRGDKEALTQQFCVYADRGSIDRLVEKLRLLEEQIEPSAGELIACVIAESGARLPRTQEMLMSDWSFRQAAILVSRLIARHLDEAARISMAKYIVTNAEPIAFGFECIRWIRVDKSDANCLKLVPEPVEIELGRILANRIHLSCQKMPIYRAHGSDAPALLWAWSEYGEPEEARSHVEASLQVAPGDVIAFIASYIGLSWGMESGLPRRSDLRRETYDAIARVIKPSVVMEHLQAIYGDKIANPSYYVSDDVVFEERLAMQFAHVHLKVVNEMSLPDDAQTERLPANSE